MSSKDCGRSTPPMTTIFIRGRTASSLAMLRALVTTVSAASDERWSPLRSTRVAISRATSVFVVPPFRPITDPVSTNWAAAAAIRRFWSGCRLLLYRSGRS